MDDLDIQTTFNDDDNMNEIEGGDIDVQDTENITE